MARANIPSGSLANVPGMPMSNSGNQMQFAAQWPNSANANLSTQVNRISWHLLCIIIVLSPSERFLAEILGSLKTGHVHKDQFENWTSSQRSFSFPLLCLFLLTGLTAKLVHLLRVLTRGLVRV